MPHCGLRRRKKHLVSSCHLGTLFFLSNLQMLCLFVLHAVGGAVSMQVQVSPKVLNVSIGQSATLDCNFSTQQPLTNLIVGWTLYQWGSENSVQVSSALR